MSFFLKYWQYIVIAIGVAALIWFYNSWLDGIYDEGYKACEAAQQAAALNESQKAVEVKVKNDAKFQAMPISDLDRYGIERGWVRPLEAR